jgi:hypothetical protein
MRIAVMLLLLLMCSCRTEYVPLEVVRYDSIMTEKLMRDSVYVRDSVYIQDKGDTVYMNKDRYVYVLKEVADTFYVYRDREVEVPVPVERKLNWWERLKLEYAEWIIGAMVAIALIYALRQWLERRRRKE